MLFKGRLGNVKWIYANNESNWPVHEQIVDTKEGDVVFVEEFGCNGRAIFGELVSKYILLYLQAKAVVTTGKMRDAAALIRENYPIWCIGLTPVGCFNKKVEPLSGDICKTHKEMYDGAIAVCDDCGVVIIPKEHHTEEFYQKLVFIEEQEDIWFDRLDRHKENTFEIVCLKNYLKEK